LKVNFISSNESRTETMLINVDKHNVDDATRC